MIYSMVGGDKKERFCPLFKVLFNFFMNLGNTIIGLIKIFDVFVKNLS